jgi:hypothetical protein
MAITDLPVRSDLKPVGLSGTLGDRWRKDDPDFWRRLSPLAVGRQSATEEAAQTTRQLPDPETEAFIQRLRQLRDANVQEARRDATALKATRHEADLRLPAINGSMDDRDDDVEEEPWP